jgi:chromosome segregation ATPase
MVEDSSDPNMTLPTRLKQVEKDVNSAHKKTRKVTRKIAMLATNHDIINDQLKNIKLDIVKQHTDSIHMQNNVDVLSNKVDNVIENMQQIMKGQIDLIATFDTVREAIKSSATQHVANESKKTADSHKWMRIVIGATTVTGAAVYLISQWYFRNMADTSSWIYKLIEGLQ